MHCKNARGGGEGCTLMHMDARGLTSTVVRSLHVHNNNYYTIRHGEKRELTSIYILTFAAPPLLYVSATVGLLTCGALALISFGMSGLTRTATLKPSPPDSRLFTEAIEGNVGQ